MSSHSVAAALLLFLAPVTFAFADNADLSGHWQVDSSKTSSGEDAALSLDIKQSGSQLSIVRTYLNEHGKQVEQQFKCTIGGGQCPMDDEGHNATVSFWYDGPALIMLKTNGDKRDSTVEWRLQLNSDKKLQASREVMEPFDKTQKVIFNKVETVASR